MGEIGETQYFWCIPITQSATMHLKRDNKRTVQVLFTSSRDFDFGEAACFVQSSGKTTDSRDSNTSVEKRQILQLPENKQRRYSVVVDAWIIGDVQIGESPLERRQEVNPDSAFRLISQ